MDNDELCYFFIIGAMKGGFGCVCRSGGSIKEKNTGKWGFVFLRFELWRKRNLFLKVTTWVMVYFWTWWDN